MATTNSVKLRIGIGIGLALLAFGARAAPGVRLEDMTWPELRERIAAGATTVLVPIGGTEQNGPHMELGKHNVRAEVLAVRIAEKLGNAIVAPVVAYVPEGSITPPSQHMRWPGTISIPDAAFEATLVGAARSFRQHGLCHVVLLGDHGGYRASLDRVAATVNKDWARHSNCRVYPLPEYYRAADRDFAAWLKSRGYAADEIGVHAGLADTSLALAADPALVRPAAMAARAPGKRGDGVVGDPRRASAELGRAGLDHIVDVTVAAVRAQLRAAP